jgi:PAS domain-containing protein
MYGIEPEDDASSAGFYFKRMHPKDRPEVEQAYAAALLRKTDFKADFRIVRPDGTIINTRSIGHPILDERGDVAEFVGASIDVTEHHRAEQALRRSEAYLAEAQRLAKTGSWAYNPAAERAIYWSDEMLRIFGLDPQRSNPPDREEFLRLVHPEDRDRFNERIDKAFREKADFVLDYRIVLTDGTVKHIHGIGHPVLDETGNIVEYVRHGTWTPDAGDAGRQAPRARCSPVHHAIISDYYAVYRVDKWQRRSKHTELDF